MKELPYGMRRVEVAGLNEKCMSLHNNLIEEHRPNFIFYIVKLGDIKRESQTYIRVDALSPEVQEKIWEEIGHKIPTVKYEVPKKSWWQLLWSRY